MATSMGHDGSGDTPRRRKKSQPGQEHYDKVVARMKALTMQDKLPSKTISFVSVDAWLAELRS